MQFGVFLPSATNGFILSVNSPQYAPSWELNRDVTRKCEELGFEFALSMVKHRGFGGPSGYWNEALDSFTLMGALAVVTERITLIPSVPILAVHPALAARQAVTVDQIAGGRFALNIVTGWYRGEYLPMGLWPGEEHYARRYDYATEYVRILHELWQTGRCSFDGEFFALDDAECLPRPPRSIPIVCAGQSDRGLRFTAELGDQNFVSGNADDVAGLRARLDQACATSGRRAGTLALTAVVAAPTDAEAQERYRWIVEGADLEAIANMGVQLQLDAQGGASANALIAERSVWMGQTPIVGSYATVARELEHLERHGGAEGIMLSFPDWLADLEAFGEHVIPRVGRAGAAPA
jgi:pyrimidine oxygenase